MSSVYLARDPALNRQLALKVLPPALMHDPSFMERFLAEARAIAAFNHPHIVVIYDIGETEGMPYIAMEYVSGPSLAQLLQQGPLPTTDLPAILSQVAAALDYAHSRGILHRDIKPGNIILGQTETHRPQVKLLDFGLVKVLRSSDNLTTTGMIVGTPAYMAPEQAEGQVTGPPADLYALGTVAYEMLTGQTPFKADTPLGIILKRVNEPPLPPSRLRLELTPEVDAVILKVLAKQPQDRYPTAAAFVEALTTALGQTVLPASVIRVGPPPPSGQVQVDPHPTPRNFTTPTAPPVLSPPVAASPGCLARLWPAFRTSAGGRQAAGHPVTVAPPPNRTAGSSAAARFEIAVPPSPSPAGRQPLSQTAAAPPPQVPPSLILNPSASLILRPHLYQLLDPLKQSTIRELLHEQQPERLVDYIVAYGGRRFIITGYGSFGGTTLTREIVQAVERQLRQQQSSHRLLALRFDLMSRPDEAVVFNVSLANDEPFLVGESLATGQGPVLPAYRLSETLDTLAAMLAGQPVKSPLARRLEGAGQSKTPPTRPVIVIDKINDPETLELFLRHPLFEHKTVTWLVVTPRELYDRWSDSVSQRLLKHHKFEVWPVPSLWEADYSVVQKTVDLCFSSYQVNSLEARDLHRAFVQHISFVSRGALGAILNELQQLKYWRLDDQTRQPFIDFNALDRDLIRHNASLQTILENNWSRISGQNFPGRERTDRARQGVYALLDWIIDHATFSLDEVRAAAGQTPIIISPHSRLRSDVVMRLLDVLVEYNYLQRAADEFDIIWGREVNLGHVQATQVIDRRDDIAFWEEQLKQRRRNWQKLQKNMSNYAEGEVPLHLENALEAEEKGIEEAEARLAALRGNNVTDKSGEANGGS
jgi:serine/threonine-protein kinase